MCLSLLVQWRHIIFVVLSLRWTSCEPESKSCHLQKTSSSQPPCSSERTLKACTLSRSVHYLSLCNMKSILYKDIGRKKPSISFNSTSLSFILIAREVLCWQGHSLYFIFFLVFLALCDQQKPQIAYKDLMKGYHNRVNTLAGHKNKTEVTLVVNLFQSVLDGFIRGEIKRAEAEPAKVRLRALFQSAGCNLALDKSESFISPFWVHSGHQDDKEEEEKGQMCKLNVLVLYFWRFPVVYSWWIVCTYFLRSLTVLWITCSAHTRWTLCSHVTCVAPTSGEWKEPTCAAVSEKRQ